MGGPQTGSGAGVGAARGLVEVTFAGIPCAAGDRLGAVRPALRALRALRDGAALLAASFAAAFAVIFGGLVLLQLVGALLPP